MLANYFFRVALIVAAVLSMVQPVQAFGTVASIPQYKLWTTYPTANTWYYGTNKTTICANWFAVISGATSYQIFNNGSDNCRVYYTTPNGYNYSVSGSYDSNGTSCPENATGSPCTCADPYVANAGATACEIPTPPPPTTCTAYPVASYIEFIGGLGNQPSQACVQSCLFNTGSGISWGVAPNRQWQASGRSTGEFCPDNTAAAQSIDDPSCPAGEILNASGVCTPLAMCPYDATIYAINVNCHPALCSTDASLYASSPLCPAPAASAVPVVVDCAVTPNDPICAGAVSGVAPIVTGTPGTSGVYQAPTMAPLGISGGTQNGDVTVENCMMNSAGGVVCVGDIGNIELDQVGDDVPLGDLTVDIGTITPVVVGSTGGCPAPSPMVLHGQTYYFDWTTYCNFASWIKPLLLAFSWLAAAGILVGGFVA